ncbi:MAG: heme ABC transporter ATP-binding protein [Agarilytica sp.]
MNQNYPNSKARQVLSVDHVSIKREGRELLKDISVELNSGEVLAIIGPNGAGKTTLLNTITGELTPNHGSVHVCGQMFKDWGIQIRAKSLAVLPQLSLLNFPYTVHEVVSLGRTPHSTGVEIDDTIIQGAMVLMDIEYLSDRLYTQLSGGEKQRVQLARVMTQIWRDEDAEQRLLLLDEPTTALDIAHQQMLMNAVATFSKNGAAVCMVVHDVNIAANFADKVIALRNGETLAVGTAEDVITEKTMTALFGAEIEIVEHPKTKNKVILT